MGITIHYRGGLDDLSRIEQMEDRVVDLVLALGGTATIWRSYADHDSTRIVRGLVLQMASGQETTSLLVSPEGQLVNLFEIKLAEQAPLKEAPWCSVKTQFGSVQGHIAVVLLLDALKEQYVSNLEVIDDSGYWEHHDTAELARQMKRLGDAITALRDGLDRLPLSPEAAEDPEIVAARVERVAALVAQRMSECRDGETDQQATENENLANQQTGSERHPPWEEASLEDEVAEPTLPCDRAVRSTKRWHGTRTNNWRRSSLRSTH